MAPAGRRRVPGRAGVTPLAAVMAAALLALAPALSWAQHYRVTGVTITSSPPASGFYTEANTITVQVRFIGAGGVRRSFGRSGGRIGLDIGGVNRSATVGAATTSVGSRVFTHDLTYRVQAGDRDLDGISVPANSLGGDWDCGHPATCVPSLSHSAHTTTQKVLASPARPAGFRAVGGAGSARLTWTRDSGAHSSRYYEYNYRPDGGTYGSWSRAGGQSASAFTVTGLSAGEYDFQLRAVNQTGTGRAAGRGDVRVTAGTGGGGTPSPSTPSEPARVVVDTASLTVVEGRSRTYAVDLDARPTGEVTVTIASNATAVVTVTPTELTFTTGNWNTQQRVTVTALQDADEANGSATLSHTASGGGATETGPTVRVTVTDDDKEGVNVPAELTFGEKTVSAKSYTVGEEVSEMLPAATGGTEPLSYAVTPDLPEGLSFNEDTLVLSGTPTEAAAQTEYTLTVTDADDYTDDLSFFITVQAADVPVDQKVKKARGTALGNVLGSFGGAIADDAVEVIGDRFTAVGPLLQLPAPPPGGAMPAGSAFAAPAPGGFALWGRGALSGFNTATEDGSVLSGYVGADWRWTPDLLVGGALAFSGAGDMNYYSAGVKGKATVNVAAVLPYAHYTPLPGLGVWGLAGLGGGSAAVTPDGTKKAITTGMFMSLGAIGARYDLLGFPGGSAAVKADGHLAWLSTGAKDDLEAASAMPGRVRLLVEGRYRWEFLEQSWLLPVVEVGGRYDGALGAEFGGGIAYRHTGLGLGAEVRGRYLLAADQEWGASAELSYTPGESGWTFALIPEWGLPQSGAAELWAGSGVPNATAAGPAPARLRLQAGYRGAESFTLNLAATREEDPAAPIYGLLINGSLRM